MATLGSRSVQELLHALMAESIAEASHRGCSYGVGVGTIEHTGTSTFRDAKQMDTTPGVVMTTSRGDLLRVDGRVQARRLDAAFGGPERSQGLGSSGSKRSPFGRSSMTREYEVVSSCPRMGFTLAMLDPSRHPWCPCVIENVEPGSWAETEGIEVGSELLAVNNRRTTDMTNFDLFQTLHAVRPLRLTLVRPLPFGVADCAVAQGQLSSPSPTYSVGGARGSGASSDPASADAAPACHQPWWEGWPAASGVDQRGGAHALAATAMPMERDRMKALSQGRRVDRFTFESGEFDLDPVPLRYSTVRFVEDMQASTPCSSMPAGRLFHDLMRSDDVEYPCRESLSSASTSTASCPRLDGRSAPSLLPAERQEAVAASRRKTRGGRTRLCCHIHLHMQLPGFDFIPRLIGSRGRNTRRIADATGAKVRIRGRGSGHKETSGREAATPLMVAVTANFGDTGAFRQAVSMVLEEVRLLVPTYLSFCRKRGIKPADSLYSVGPIDDHSRNVLEGVFDEACGRPDEQGCCGVHRHEHQWQ
mmetsp:Transcript_8102/g.20208  ORF Transcript_8102/g.20208 Transcript_8102/m.20208 type:complete len:533 (-) Transcript_8102:195-1793(-)